MNTVAATLAALGVEPADDADLVFAVIDHGCTHYTYPQVAGKDVAADFPKGLCLAGGEFEPGAIFVPKKEGGGRQKSNVARVFWLAFDADLKDFLGLDEAGVEDMRRWDQPTLDGFLRDLRGAVEDAFAAVGLPMHRLDCTGYGLCAYAVIDPAIRGKVEPLDRLYKHLVALLNEAAGEELFDKQVSDAGTRIARLPGSVNAKNPSMPRPVVTLFRQDGYLDAALANRLMETAPPRRERTATSPSAPGTRVLRDDEVDAIVHAVAPFYSTGRRHLLARHVAGFLIKAGVSDEQTERVIWLLSADDEEQWDRLNCVRTTRRRIEAGLDVQGYSGLRQEMGPAGAAQLDYVDGLLRPPTPRLVLPARDLEVPSLRREAWPDPPQSCWRPFFQRYLDLVAPCTEAPPAFHLASALAISGSIVGRRAWVEYAGRLYPNLYLLLIGSAGTSRKSTAMRLAESWRGVAEGVAFWNPPFSVIRDATTSAFLLKHLNDNPTTLLVLDEYARLLKTTRRDYAADVPSLILSLYTGDPVEHNVASGTTRVEAPHFSILAGIQPGVLATEMAGDGLRSGFVSRFLHFPGEGQDFNPFPPGADRVGIARLFRELDAFADVAGVVPMTSTARDQWADWYVNDKKRPVSSEAEDAARVRLADNALKVALLYAVSEGESFINVYHLGAATDLIEWQWGCVRSMLPRWGATVTRRIQSRITQVLGERPMTRWEVMRAVDDPDWDLEQASKVFDLMTKNELVAGGLDGLWRVREA